MATKEIGGMLKADGLRLCVVISRFNDFLTKQLLGGAIDCFTRHGGREDSLMVVWVPGANELPMTIQKVLQSGKYDAAVALGVVVEGSTKHADLINSQVSKALGSIALSSSVPVINGVVAADNLEQAIERCGTKAGNKGWSAMQAAIEMANVYKQIGK
ncbi:MAG: 6,7-dimethyl-8-ribityllumazine synthase [bacterium]